MMWSFWILQNSTLAKHMTMHLVAQLLKESTRHAGDTGSTPGSGSSPGEGIGYPLQSCLASPMAQTVKNPPTMQETWVWSTGWEDPLEEGMATHSSIWPGESPWAEEPGGATVSPWGRKESDMTTTAQWTWALTPTIHPIRCVSGLSLNNIYWAPTSWRGTILCTGGLVVSKTEHVSVLMEVIIYTNK